MKQRRKKPCEKGLAIHSIPSFALGIVRCTAKRKQGNRWGGLSNSEDAIGTPTQLKCAAGGRAESSKRK
jgi:hypothetical protein